MTTTFVMSARDILENFAKKYGILNFKDWYRVNLHDVYKDKQVKLLVEKHFSGSLARALIHVYPDVCWNIKKIPKVHEEYKQKLSLFSEKNNFIQFSDWYRVSVGEIRAAGLFSILQVYGNSLINALQNIYPEYDWKPWRFEKQKLPTGFFESTENQREYLEDFFKTYNLKEWQDWYNVKIKDIIDFGGRPLLEKYDFSKVKLLMTVFPEREWIAYKFARLPAGFWNSEKNVKQYFIWLSKELNINNSEDWISVTKDVIQNYHGTTLLLKYGSTFKILAKYLPEFFTDVRDSNKRRAISKSQLKLLEIIQELYPNEKEIFVSYIHPDLTFSESKKQMELDIFIPSLNIAFEYQGEQHFKSR